MRFSAARVHMSDATGHLAPLPVIRTGGARSGPNSGNVPYSATMTASRLLALPTVGRP